MLSLEAALDDKPIDSLPFLQDSIKRDPTNYKDDFLNQYLAFEAELEMVIGTPLRLNKELTMFISQTCNFYGKTEQFTETLLRLLKSEIGSAKTYNLRVVVAALTLLDNKGHLDKNKAYQVFLEVLDSDTEEIPKILLKQLIKGLCAVRDQSQCRQWQRIVFGLFESSRSSVYSRRLIFILISLYLKQSWNDVATVNAIAEGLFSSCPKVAECAARFLLGDAKRLHISTVGDKADVVDEDEAQKQADLVASISKELSFGMKAKKKKTKKKIERMKLEAEKNLAKMEGKADMQIGLTFEIMDKLYDPHRIAERIYQRSSKNNNKDPFKLKLLCLTVCARLMGKYEVSIPGFFGFFNRYLKPSQSQVTRILAAVAQAVHSHVGQDELQETSRLIADQFILESSPPEVLTVGINTIREMCARNINAITPELLGDLIDYKKEGRNGDVRIAASALRNLFRVKAPELLPRKHRGKRMTDIGTESANPDTSRSMIEGIDILLKLKDVQNSRKRKRGEDVDEVTSEVLMAKQSNEVLSAKDFAALKKIRLKIATAKSMGLNLNHWLDSDDNWNRMANDVLGERAPVHKKRKLNQEAVSESDDASSGEEEFDEKELAEFGLEETDVESTDSSESDSTNASAAGDEDVPSEDDEEDAREEVLTGASLKGREKLSRKQAQLLAHQNKRAKQQAAKDERREGKQTNRAGITNKVAARNKPMSMLRQKRSVKDKRQKDAKAKVQGLRAHVKTLKQQTRQKLRRR